MRTSPAACSLAAALTLATTLASAQRPPNHKQPPLVLEKQQLGTAAFATVARARMSSGDCAGALDAFDAAINHSMDATLRRDRGLCHEQLGHPYPAIDDYRAYLTAKPDEPDSDGIRVRLAKLEESTSGKSSQGDDDDVPPAAPGGTQGATTGSASASATVKIGTDDAVNADGTSGTQPSSGSQGHDAMDYVEHDNDVMRSPLRRGKGFSFAPYFAEHKWFNSGASFGESDTWAECIGLQLRYSLGRIATVFLEGAYQHFNSNSSSTDSLQGTIQGLTSQVGLELRFPLDEDYDNEFIVAPGLGFDHIVATTTLASNVTTTAGAIIPRVRAGWRHMLDSNAAIDLSLDFGVGKFAQYDGDFPFGGNGSEVAMIAANAALVWGL
jgi:hypothetical protein